MTSILTKSSALRRGLTAALVIGAMTVQAQQAAAVSMAVQMACLSDYLAYCSKHEVGSPALRACMNANGAKLSKRCVNGLIAAGEVSKAEVDRRSAAAR